MKLAVFTSQFPGRTASFFARDIRGLMQAGIDVDIFPLYPLDASLWKCVPEILNQQVLPPEKVHHIAIQDCLKTFRPRSARRFLSFLRDTTSISASAVKYGMEPLLKSGYVFLKAWAWAQLCPNTYDRVLGYWGNYPSSAAYLYHRLCGVKNPLSLFLHANVDLYRKPIFMQRKMLYADQIITCSEFNRNFITNSFPAVRDSIADKLFVHHHGLDINKLPVSQSSTRTAGRVIAVGRFVEQKGFEYLLRAVALLKRKGVQVTLDLVGDGEQAPQLRALARELDIEADIKFLGWLPADEVPGVISRAMMLVHPSPDLGDGVPNVIKESMAVGTLVVGSNVAGIPEMLGNGERGVLVPPKNVVALAEAIAAFLHNENDQRGYTRRAREYAEENFDMWKNGLRLAQTLARH